MIRRKTSIRSLAARTAMTLLMMLMTATTAGAQEAISGLTYNTAGGYYEIKDAQDLVDLATYVKNGGDTYGKTFKQTANITFAHTSDWNDTSSEENNFNSISTFKGSYYGQGFTISGVRMHFNFGLFYCAYGAIVDGIVLTDSRITNHENTAGIVGYTYENIEQGNKPAIVNNCHVRSNVLIHTLGNYRAQKLGGVVGTNGANCQVTNCTSSATITGHTGSGFRYNIGGIVGENRGIVSNNIAIDVNIGSIDSGYGAIVGTNTSNISSGILSNNYYFNCTVSGHTSNIGCDGADVTTDNGAYNVSPDHFEKTATNEYTIHTAEGWGVFCDLLANNDKSYFSGKTVCLGADIPTAAEIAAGTTAITRMAGCDNHDFCGTFEGGGHTLNVDISSTSDRIYTAPFSYISNVNDNSAAIRNLKVTGKVNATKDYAGGIVGAFWGTLNIENCTSSVEITTGNKYAGGIIAYNSGKSYIKNCLSSATIKASVSGDGTHGGIIGVCQPSTSTDIKGCVFNGSLLTTTSTDYCGGFVGWNAGATSISNSLYAPASVNVITTNSATFSRGNAPTISNSYYTATLGTAQGKAPRTVSAGERVTVSDVSPVGSPTSSDGYNGVYTVSGITAYAKGIKRGGTFYYGSGDNVSLTLSHGEPSVGYTFSGYAASGGGTLNENQNQNENTGKYTLTMPDADVTINAAWTPITYHITYHPNGGEFTTDKNTFTIESETITLDVPTRKGYTFGGWYNNSGLTGDAVTTIAAGSHADVELWAKWTVITYSITYNLDGGTVATANPTTYNVETETFTLNNPTKPGYTFTGWTLDDNTLLTTVTIEKGSIDHRTYTAHFEIIHFTQGDLSYECTSGTEVKVTACNSSATNVTIPATVTDSEVTYSVTAIDAAAFSGCTALTSITIPASVTSIGNMSFKDCSGLESITVATGNGTYDSRNACNAIIETVSNKLILGCKTTVIPHGVKVIGDHAFRSCTGLTNISIPTSVTSIDKAAFYGCTGLTTVIMQAITPPTLGDYVFEGCQALSAIGVPAGSASAYSSATNWSAYAYKIFTIDGTSGDGVYWSYNSTSKTMTIFGTGAMSNYSWGDRPWYNFRSDITTVDICSGVTSIGRSAFESCAYLTTVIIRRVESPITQLGIDALDYCSALTGIYVPKDKVNDYKTDDNWSTYADKIQVYDTCCDGVYWLYNSNDNTLIISGTGEMPNFSNGNQPWYSYCNDITKVDIREGVTSIGESAFKDCSRLEEINIPASVTTIGESAFKDCSWLEEINIPASVTSISNWAFDGCTGLTTVTMLATTPPTLGDYAFYDCNALTTIYIPVGTAGDYKTATNWRDFETKMQGYDGTCGDGVYYSYNSTSKTLTIFGTGAMADYSWGDCPWFNFRSDITTVDIRAGVTSIGDDAFDGCYDLTSITIPASVTSIGEDAFYRCHLLEEISIPTGMTSIGRHAFAECVGLVSISVAPGNKIFDSRNDCNAIIHTASNTLIQGCGCTVIPNSVTSIDDEAFFEYWGCMTSIDIPNSVTSIGDAAFYNCSDLTNITIPASVMSIGDDAFENCSDLAMVFMQATTPPTLGSHAFDDCDDELIIYVPAGTAATYMKAPGWQNYAEIIKEIDGVSLVNIAMNTDGIMTYASAYDLDFSAVSGLTAYVASSISEGTLTLTPVEKVPAGTGLLLKGEAGKTFTVPTTSSATAVGNNLLVGLTAETDVNQTTADGIAFILAHGNHGINWYRLAENSYTLKANSAYLRLSASVAPSASRTLTMAFEDGATGVTTVSSLNGGEWYDLNGRKLSKKPTRKGLYIFNGRKTLIK